jgi:hypothetical protein
MARYALRRLGCRDDEADGIVESIRESPTPLVVEAVRP